MKGFDRIITSAPVNKDAAMARDGGGIHYEFETTVEDHWEAPPEGMIVDSDPLIGRKFARFAVVGRMISGKKVRFVCRCACGNYEPRTARAISKTSDGDRCAVCRQTQRLQWLARATESEKKAFYAKFPKFDPAQRKTTQ